MQKKKRKECDIIQILLTILYYLRKCVICEIRTGV